MRGSQWVGNDVAGTKLRCARILNTDSSPNEHKRNAGVVVDYASHSSSLENGPHAFLAVPQGYTAAVFFFRVNCSC